MNVKQFGLLVVLFLGGVFFPGIGSAEQVYTIVIKENRFVPAEIEVPAGVKVKLIIDNQDSTPEEFESHDLNREKIIAAKSKGIVLIGPLKKGEYKFFGEFHPATAQGVIQVVENLDK